jgi:hypothetical protein
MRDTRPMTPLDPTRTRRAPTYRAGKRQIWEAVSRDGRWAYVRMEMPGSPWVITNLKTEQTRPDFFGTLSAARRETHELDARRPRPGQRVTGTLGGGPGTGTVSPSDAQAIDAGDWLLVHPDGEPDDVVVYADADQVTIVTDQPAAEPAPATPVRYSLASPTAHRTVAARRPSRAVQLAVAAVRRPDIEKD